MSRPLDDDARAAVSRQLSPAEWSLFCKFPNEDQQHSYRVWRLLRQSGYDHPSLLKAALLHDVGKINSPLNVIDRSIGVLGQLLIPSWARRWGTRPLAESTRWQLPFVVRRQHARWGMELLRSAGSDPLTIELVGAHQDPAPSTMDPETQKLLSFLKWADDQN